MNIVPRYTLQKEVTEGPDTLLLRGIRDADGHPVLVRMFKEDYPPLSAVARLKAEYELTGELRVPGVLRPLGLESTRHAPALVFEGVAGIPLRQLLATGPLPLERFLPIAIQLADTLGELHTHRVIHKGLTPEGILVDPEHLRVTLVDLGHATRLVRETQAPGAVDRLEGMLAYLSPEQTGRMNRTIDCRSDLYSLGVILYELLTGVRPFIARDPLELIHCHIARPAVSPVVHRPDCPPVLARLVLKLLAKTAEDRYQSAAGLAADLREASRQWEGGSGLADFPLGQLDLPSGLTIPEKLYGRERELDLLLAAVERVARGGVELMLVSGYAGIGKTSLVHELHKPLAAWWGHLAAGKFDQLQRDAPYASLAQAFRKLLRVLLSEPQPLVEAWKSRLLAALSHNARLMVDLVPELERFIGPQPAVPELPGPESRARFHQAFANLVAALAAPEQPLVLFLDDVQWADPASLALLPQLLTSPSTRGLLLLCAYRDQEFPPEHPFRLLVDQLRQEGQKVAELHLGPLGEADVCHLLADTLGAPPAEVSGLAETLLAKTGGNPFFLHQLLHSLYADGLLTFDRSARQWRWDLALLQRAPHTDNVVALMVGKIQRLPPAVQDVLKHAACVGNAFDPHTLARVSELPASAIARLLWEATREGLLLPEGGTEGLLQATPEERALETGDEGLHYRFLHDRVQQAAYSLIPDAERPMTHLKIGRLLWRKRAETGEVGFDAVNHLNLGRELLADEAERRQVASLNLEAGRRAKASSAYAAAAGYFQAGRELLGERGWEDCFELKWTLTMERAECEYLLTHFTEAEALFERVLTRARTRLQRAHASRIQVMLLTNQGRHRDAYRRGVEALRLFGLDWPEDDAGVRAALARERQEIQEALRGRPILELVELPNEEDPDRLAMGLLLAHLISPAYQSFASKEREMLVTCTLVNQALRAGRVSDAAAYGFSSYAHLLVSEGDYANGYAFGKLAIEVAERHDFHLSRGRNYNLFGALINHWTSPARTSAAYLVRAFTLLSESGDLIYSTYACSNLVLIALSRGDALEQVEAEVLRYFDFVKRSQYRQMLQVFVVHRHFLRCLRGQAETPWRLTPPEGEEATSARALWALGQMKLLYLSGQLEEALAVSVESEELVPTTYGDSVAMVESRFFQAMTVAAAGRGPAGEPPQALLERAAADFRPWAASCPTNFRQQLLLIEAELARLSGRELEAMRLYDEALLAANGSGYLHLEALANELAARFHLAGGRTRMAQSYLREAHYAYARWGATAKVAELEARHPGLLGRRAARGASSAGAGTFPGSPLEGSGLDLLTVTKSSQALSGEVHLRTLVEKLLRIAMENAGSQRAVLLLVRERALFIEAEATVDRADIAVMQSIPVEATETLPHSVINYVEHTEDPLMLGDALATAPYQSDPYVVARRARSILCLPIITQKHLVGILYLEHHLAPDVFTSDRLHVLTLLSAQAAISIENARLYDTLEQRVADRTRELNERNDQLATALRQLQDTQRLLVEKEKLASLGMMNAAIAHEVKNPLNFITNFAELASELGEDLVAEVKRAEQGPSLDSFDKLRKMAGALAQFTTKVQEHSKRVERIIDAMRQHSVGHRAVHRPVDLNQLVAEHVGMTLEGLRVREPSLPVRLSTHYDGDIGQVHVAPDELGRVIASLVTNAWQAMSARYRAAPVLEPLLEVSTRDLATHVEVRIRDNGMGIPPESRSRIFTPFFTTKPPGEGTGLGLSLSYNVVVHLHGGELRFESEPGQGTEFIVTLPRN